MQKSKLKSILFACLCLCLQGYAQETITLEGIPDFSFHGGTTHRLDSTDRINIEREFIGLEGLQEPIKAYLKAYNEGAHHLAKEILNEKLEGRDELRLQLVYTLYRMKQLNLLYLPLFQVYDPSIEEEQLLHSEIIVVSCSLEQYDQLTQLKAPHKFVCQYIGELFVDNAKVYQLIGIQPN